MPDTDLFLQLAQKKPTSPAVKESTKSTKKHALKAQKTALEALEPTKPVSSPLETEKQAIKGREKDKIMTPRYRDTTMPRHHETMVSRYQNPEEPEIMETVRKSVKVLGLKAATHRFTDEEKREIAGLIFAYGNRGIATSENEITRIAINYIFEDYKQNGENSVLNKVLAALNS